MFERELAFFIKSQDELVRSYLGKVLVLRGEEVVSIHDSPLEAFLEAQGKYPLGSFMIQPCKPGPEAYTVTIASAVAPIS